MARDATGLLITSLVAFGAAALVMAWTPAAWPNPLPQGALPRAQPVPTLRAAAVAVDAACARGDLVAFASATTAAHRVGIERRLAAVERPLDAGTLRALHAEGALAPWLDGPVLAGEVRG